MTQKQTTRQEQKTFLLKKEQIHRKWYLLDATGKTLGRLCSEIAKIIRGKHKPTFTPHVDCGDHVLVINAEKIRVTGNKEAEKEYIYYTGSMSGLRRIPYRVMRDRKPGYIIEHAVHGMLPKSRLGKQQRKRLRVFAGEKTITFLHKNRFPLTFR